MLQKFKCLLIEKKTTIDLIFNLNIILKIINIIFFQNSQCKANHLMQYNANVLM